MAARKLSEGGSVGDVNGVDLEVGRLQPGGAVFLSQQLYIPREAIRCGARISAVPTGPAAPTLTVKIRQASDGDTVTGSDRGITSPTALAAFSAAADAMVNDDVVGNYFQIEITCADGECDVTAIAWAR